MEARKAAGAYLPGVCAGIGRKGRKMKQGIKGGQAPAETLTGSTLKEKESCNMCHIAGTDESKGHNRNSYSEYMERNFAYYPKL